MNKTTKGCLFFFTIIISAYFIDYIVPEDKSLGTVLLVFFGFLFLLSIVQTVVERKQTSKAEEERKETKKPSITAEEERKKPKRAPPPPCKACGSRNIETSPIGEIGTSSFRPGVHLTCRDCGWQITYRM
jgi:hypothetical protein